MNITRSLAQLQKEHVVMELESGFFHLSSPYPS
jgi:hypothetical protein